MELEATQFSDGTWVIIGEHVSKEKAQELVNKEDDLIVEEVRHFWVRHEFISEEAEDRLITFRKVMEM